MRITAIELKNFRNYEHLEQDFFPGAQILYGNNAQGKTNILEAIFLCTCARSHRTGRDSELVRQSCDDYDVRLEFLTDKDRSEEIRIHYLAPVSNDPLRLKPIRHIYYNGVRLERISDMMGIFNAVIFAPEDLQIIKDGPAARRRFLDLLLSQIYPAYFRDLIQYQHLLTQRNNLLKKLGTFPILQILTVITIYIWKFGTSSCPIVPRIISRRQEVINEIALLANESISQITGLKEELSMRYRSSVPSAKDLSREEMQEILLGNCGSKQLMISCAAVPA